MIAGFADDVVALAQDVDFLEATHTYRDPKGNVVPSVTQLIKGAGLIDYSHIRQDVLQHAAWRGKMVHQAISLLNNGEDLWSEYTVPDECVPYVQAYELFRRECDYQQHGAYNEHRMMAEVDGELVAGTLDNLGMIWGNEVAIIEAKATAAVHPCWGVQTAGYEALVRATDDAFRRLELKRYALQLKPTGKYRLVPQEDAGDHDAFVMAARRHRSEQYLDAWKAKYGLKRDA